MVHHEMKHPGEEKLNVPLDMARPEECAKIDAIVIKNVGAGVFNPLA